jgi:RNase P protein component
MSVRPRGAGVRSLGGGKTFRALRATGKVHNGEILKFFFECRKAEADGGLGVMVNKRFGTAVQRNRIKRRIREAYRTGLRGYLKQTPYLSTNISTVVLYKGVRGKPERSASFAEIQADVHRFITAIQSTGE